MSDSSNLVGKAGEVYEFCGDIAFACKKEWEAGLKTCRDMIPAYACKVVIGEDGFFRGSILNLYAVTSTRAFDEEYPVIGRFIKGRNSHVYTFFCEARNPANGSGVPDELFYVIKRNIGKIVDASMTHKGDFTIANKRRLPRDSRYQQECAEMVRKEFDFLVKERKVDEYIENFVVLFDRKKEELLDVLDQYEYTESIVCGHNS